MAKRKWAAVCADLPRDKAWDEEDPSFQEKVDAEKAELIKEFGDQISSAHVAKKFVELRAIKDQIKKQLKDANARATAVQQLLVDIYERDGNLSVTLEDGSAVDWTVEPIARVVVRDEFRRWCLENGYENQMTLPHQTMNAIVKDLLEVGQPNPPGTAVFVRDKISVRRT